MTTRTITSDMLAQALGGSMTTAGQPLGPAGISAIVTDSRASRADASTLFAALRTRLGDGHRYIQDMYQRGVRAFLVDALPDIQPADATFLVVPDVLGALGALAASINSANSRQIVVTGSTLKTEVKEMLYRAWLKDGKKVFRSPRSYNSYLGVCLSVFDDYFAGGSDIQIFEAGIDGPGQAAALRHILRPWIGIITDITTEHDENFASHEAKVAEKEALVAGAPTILRGSTPAALSALGLSLEPLEGGSLRTTVMEGVRSNTLMIDRFTPDALSLSTGIERLVRHSSPGRALVVALGDVDGDPLQALAGYPGVRLISLGAEVSADTAEQSAATLRGADILIFGGATPALEAFASALERADHDTTLTVDLDALVHNFNAYRAMVPSGTGIVAMVKASAYGMGSIEVSKALQSAGAAYLAVAVVDEGVDMRSAGIAMPVMVMNPVTRHYRALFDNRLEPAVFSMEELERLVAEAARLGIQGYPVHIKLDTGMHRVGFTAAQIPSLAQALRGCTQVRVESVFSHLATADCLDKDAYTQSQLDCFYAMSDNLGRLLGHGFRRHILNTAGMMRFAGCGPYEMSRLGIGLYGISPLPGLDGRLRPVASLTSTVLSVKHWPAGTAIGYGNRGVTTRESVIATVPIGYADGVDRRLGCGAASFRVNGADCPTIGNICMDMCMVDVTDAPDVAIGSKVEIFGPSKPVEDLAEILGTIPYEVLTSVSPRVQRAYLTR